MRNALMLLGAGSILFGLVAAQIPAAAPLLVVAPITATAYTSLDYIRVNATTTDDETGVNATLTYNIIGDWITDRMTGSPEGILRNFTGRIPVPEEATGSRTVLYFVNATDRDAQNATSGMKTLAITVADATSPSVSLSAPDSEGGRPTLTATFRDNGAGIAPATVVAKIDDVAITVATNATGFTYTPTADLAKGIHTFAVSVKDKAGNEGTDDRRFEVGAAPAKSDTPLAAWIALLGIVAGAVAVRRR